MTITKKVLTRPWIGWLLQTTARKSMGSLAAAGFSILALSGASVGRAQEHSWDKLRSLSVGTKIQVVDQHLKSVDGTFLSVSDDALIYQADDRQVTIPKQNVFRVSSREHLGRGKKALIGLGIGALAGAATGAVIGAGEGDFVGPGGVAILMAVPFGPIGAGVGAALPSGHPTIYRTDRHVIPTAPSP